MRSVVPVPGGTASPLWRGWPLELLVVVCSLIDGASGVLKVGDLCGIAIRGLGAVGEDGDIIGFIFYLI